MNSRRVPMVQKHSLTVFCVFFLCSQKQVNIEEYGPSMADLERQIAAHNILHKEIEAYSSQLCVSSAGSKVSVQANMKNTLS